MLEELGHGRNDNCNGGIFYALFLELKVKYCLTNEHGVLAVKKT